MTIDEPGPSIEFIPEDQHLFPMLLMRGWAMKIVVRMPDGRCETLWNRKDIFGDEWVEHAIAWKMEIYHRGKNGEVVDIAEVRT